jgi:lysozyme
MSRIEGIDIAEMDGNESPRWDRVRASGRRFVILRAAYGDREDRCFAVEWPRLAAAGLVRGAYLFWRAAEPAQVQAEAFVAVLERARLAAGDLPPIVDVEFPGPQGRAGTGLSVDEAIARLAAVVGVIVARLGVIPMLYTSARVWQEDLLDRVPPAPLLECPLWLARYAAGDPPTPTPWGHGNWWLHQYAGDRHGVPGLTGGADLDRAPTCSIGESSDRVAWVQRRLGVAVDRVFGPKTRAAVIAYQVRHGLVGDGMIGPATFSFLAWERPA